MNSFATVITSVNPKTKAILAFEAMPGSKVIYVGDLKSPDIEESECLTFLPIGKQDDLGFRTAKACPVNHYARKNIGYLYAISIGFHKIYEVDDDNIPLENWYFPDFVASAMVVTDVKHYNAYRQFTDKHIWPRGFPLEDIHNKAKETLSKKDDLQVAAWQGLADGDPDVDAIYRLISGEEVIFDQSKPVVLGKGTYCPFNSQNTYWSDDMITYAYIPATATFRSADIIRGYIAQRCFWEHGKHLGFIAPTVFQDRNEHDLLSDFQSELPCYLQMHHLTSILDSVTLSKNPSDNLCEVYHTLVKESFLTDRELVSVEAWLEDLDGIH